MYMYLWCAVYKLPKLIYGTVWYKSRSSKPIPSTCIMYTYMYMYLISVQQANRNMTWHTTTYTE